MRAIALKSPRNCMHQEVIRGDENERDADRSALNEAGNSRKKKKCQDEKATGNGKAGHNGQFLHVLI